ncbi:DUF86 domain-containing protein [Saccharopolyspora sp. K220]|uniref:HepT-like ribonuclease domain-containing protein n=1 Tax=Saccharopolyspora soli TaxID=2926618 RepID=UPI001F56CF63|nr:HepT-like ribonuclease domain-containing protein [Saccharopolyspora soli]MCI2424141.1 DUF86 domain-containing protein [Saccharopolyspora soli]
MGSIDVAALLRTAVRSAEMILEITPADRADLESEEVVQAALAQSLIIIGDVSSDLPASFRETHDCLPWADLMALRDRLRHRYWETTADLLWSAAQEIPRLLPEIRSVLVEVELRR